MLITYCLGLSIDIVESFRSFLLQPLNILLTSNKEYPFVKLTDFGLSKILANAIEPVKTLCGTNVFAAPEVNVTYRQVPGNFDSRCDVWSLGVLFYFW